MEGQGKVQAHDADHWGTSTFQKSHSPLSSEWVLLTQIGLSHWPSSRDDARTKRIQSLQQTFL